MELETKRAARSLGEVIREARLALSLSQEDFAERCDVHRTYLGAIERGEYNLTLETLLRIARALKQAPSELLARAGR